MPFLDLPGGVRVAYADRGAGPPLVLVHGWSFGAAVLEALPPEVLAGRRGVAPDLRGHGASRAAADGPGDAAGITGRRFVLEDLAGDLAALLEALRLEGAALVGWSLGAQVALAALPRVRPRLSRLVLVSATPCFTLRDDWPHGLPAAALAALVRRVRRDPAGAVARFSEGMFADGERDPAARSRAAALRTAIPPPDPDAALAGLDVLAATDLRAALAAVDLPTLVVHGAQDPICPAGAGRALAAAIPGARLALLPGAGHAPFLTRPAELTAALLPFLES